MQYLLDELRLYGDLLGYLESRAVRKADLDDGLDGTINYFKGHPDPTKYYLLRREAQK